MKLILLTALLFSFAAQARVALPVSKGSPLYFGEEAELQEDLQCDERFLELSYDFSVNNAASGDSIALPGSVPADYLVTQVAIYVDSVVVSASDNTIALDCESSGDLLSAADLTDDSANSVVNGAVTALSGAVYSSDGCTPTMTIGAGTTGISSGDLHFLLKLKNKSDACLDDE
jgi:hypothetical protein